MTMRMRVSIVIPVHNEEDMIGPCLDAILGQTIPADEVIVVDNNSTDSTGDRLMEHEGRVIVLSEPRQGVCFARNTGFDAATGDVIGRIDADTRLPPVWIEQIQAIFADSTVQAATGPTRYYDILLPRLVARLDLLLRTAWARSGRQQLDWVYGANMAIRGSAWRAVRPLLCDVQGVHEDVDLGIHLYQSGERVVFSPTLVASTSARRIRDSFPSFRAYLAMTERGYSTHPGLAHSNAYRRAWLTARVILICYFPLHFLHRACLPNNQRLSLRALRTAVVPRKNPMSGS